MFMTGALVLSVCQQRFQSPRALVENLFEPGVKEFVFPVVGSCDAGKPEDNEDEDRIGESVGLG